MLSCKWKDWSRAWNPSSPSSCDVSLSALPAWKLRRIRQDCRPGARSSCNSQPFLASAEDRNFGLWSAQSCSKSTVSRPSREACDYLRTNEPNDLLFAEATRPEAKNLWAALKRQIRLSNIQQLRIELLPRSYDLPLCDRSRLHAHLWPILVLSAFRIRSVICHCHVGSYRPFSSQVSPDQDIQRISSSLQCKGAHRDLPNDT
jgi:hypothetical protein